MPIWLIRETFSVYFFNVGIKLVSLKNNSYLKKHLRNRFEDVTLWRDYDFGGKAYVEDESCYKG